MFNRIPRHLNATTSGVAPQSPRRFPRRRAPLDIAVSGLLALVLGLCSVGGAQAALTRSPLFHLGEIPTQGSHGEPVALPGPLGKMESMTVDNGHLWVAEELNGASRVDEFDAATGAFIAQPIHAEAPSGSEPPTGYGAVYGEGIAVAHGPGEAAVYVGGEQHGAAAVLVFGESGAPLATWQGHATPAGSFGPVSEVGVDNSTSPLDAGRGNVLVVSSSAGRIDVFHPEADGEERYVGTLTGTSPSEPFKFPARIAIDEVTGDLYVLDLHEGQTAVDVFEPTGLGGYAFVRKFGGPPPAGRFGGPYTFTVDGASGEVDVADFAPEGTYLKSDYLIDEFTAAGTYLGHIEGIPDAFAIAIDPVSHDLYAREVVYGPDVVVPDVTTSPVSAVKAESATLGGMVDPDGAGEAKCWFEWGPTPALGTVTPCSKEIADGESPVAVQLSLGGLQRDATYYYRLEASNANGVNQGDPWQNETFTTRGAAVRNVSVSDVSAGAAVLEATINPGATSTTYYFQYGTSKAYGEQVPAPPGEAIGSGGTDVEVPAQRIEGLAPGTVYHYRVVTVNESAPSEFETVAGEDHTFTTQPPGGAFALPDGRQWELVSPPSKLGGLVQALGGSGGHVPGAIQSAAAGNAIAWRTTAPSEVEPQANAYTVTVLSTRGADGWSSQDISSPHDQVAGSGESVGNEFRLFSTDLSSVAVTPASSAFTPLSPQASEATTYLRTNYLDGNVEEHCGTSCYLPLVTGKTGYANVPPGTVFGEEPEDRCEDIRSCGPRFQGANPDLSHVILSSPVQLTSTPAPAGGPGWYEWSEGRLQLLDVLPEGEAGPAILAGKNPYTVGHTAVGARHAISDNGERVVLEGGALGGQGLYLRDVAAGQTTRLDTVQGGSGPSEAVNYMTASNDASRIFFLDSGHLTSSSSASGEDLYEYDLNAPAGSRLTDLTADANGGEAADVTQVLGASEDGSYVYFVAGGQLAAGAAAGGESLYVRHAGVTTLVGVLSPQGPGPVDWTHALLARVSPNGRWLAFMSNADLTGYDTRDAVSGRPDMEVYLYDAQVGKLVCASCDPTGARPTGVVIDDGESPAHEGIVGMAVAGSVPPWTEVVEGEQYGPHTFTQPRYLSDSGRLFFDSPDALLPQDVNGVEDAYEFEPASVGDCSAASATFSALSNGCVDLISSGTSPAESAFLEASESGSDVFFITQARLAPQDYDTSYDVYDAHECTSAAPCYPAPAPQRPPCDTETSCKGGPSPQPSFYGEPASATFSGTGNLAAPSTPAVKTKTKPKAKHKIPKCGRRARGRHCAKTRRAAKSRRHKGTRPAGSPDGGKR